jgi:hypothetical protein
MNRKSSSVGLPAPADIDAAADRITDAVLGLGAISVLMMTLVVVFTQ